MNPSPLFLCSTLFAFLCAQFRIVLDGQHRRCVALFYIGDSLRFPAYNGNEMPPSIRTPPWYTNHDACCSFLCGNFCASLRARAWGILAGMSRNTTSKAPQEKPDFFLAGGQSLFYGQRFSAEILFLCAVLCGCAGVEGAFPCGGVPSWNREEKRPPRPLPARGARLQTEAEPGYFPL